MSSSLADLVAAESIAFCDDAAEPKALLEAADAALYQAKGTGRDRICLFEVASPELTLPAIQADFAGAIVRLRRAERGRRA